MNDGFWNSLNFLLSSVRRVYILHSSTLFLVFALPQLSMLSESFRVDIRVTHFVQHAAE